MLPLSPQKLPNSVYVEDSAGCPVHRWLLCAIGFYMLLRFMQKIAASPASNCHQINGEIYERQKHNLEMAQWSDKVGGSCRACSPSMAWREQAYTAVGAAVQKGTGIEKPFQEISRRPGVCSIFPTVLTTFLVLEIKMSNIQS